MNIIPSSGHVIPSDAMLAASFARGPLVGTFIGLVLYGATCMQAFLYFRTYEDDTRGLKIMVALLVVLETAHAIMTMWVMDDYLIAHYANLLALESANWSSTLMYILGLLIDFNVYLYFTWRIWLFTMNKYIVALMTVLSMSRTATGIFLAIRSVTGPLWNNYLDTFRALLVAANALFVVGDTLLAVTMAYYLTKLKSWVHGVPSGRPRRIHLLLNYLLVFAVATGALTLLVDIVALTLTLSVSQGLAYQSAVIIQTRLVCIALGFIPRAARTLSATQVYANSLLASLNIRNAASRTYDAPSTQVELPATSLRFAPPSVRSTDTEEAGTQGRVDDHDETKA